MILIGELYCWLAFTFCCQTLTDARGSILTQLPLPDTVQDLWRLVESCDVRNIVSLGSADCLQQVDFSFFFLFLFVYFLGL